jgi:hypothetical protein
LRFCFAFLIVDERNGDVSAVIVLIIRIVWIGLNLPSKFLRDSAHVSLLPIQRFRCINPTFPNRIVNRIRVANLDANLVSNLKALVVDPVDVLFVSKAANVQGQIFASI